MNPDGNTWHFQAGDPTFLGWATFTAYLLAALLAGYAWRVSLQGAKIFRSARPQEANRQDRLAMWWLGMVALMTVLGLNKELDLQGLVDKWGKAAALSQGWYADRKTVKIAFTVVLFLLTAGAVATMFRYFRIVWDRIALAMAGVALVLVYALLRAAVFYVPHHKMPDILESTMWVPELLGVMLVIWSGMHAVRNGGMPRA